MYSRLLMEGNVDEATQEVATYVEGIKHTPELESGIMTLQDKIDLERRESFDEGRREGIEVGEARGRQELLISLVKEGKLSIANAAASLNMPVRFLVYLGQEYQKIIEKSSKSIYGTSIVQLPTPKCVVFYNGEKEIEDEQVIKLSDAYINKDVIPDAELTVRVININYGHNKELMDKCEKLMEYSKFMEILRENQKRYGIKRAIKESIEYCLDNNILTDFLREHRAEVPGFLLTNFDKRKYERTIREEGFEDGRQEGIEIGEERGRQELLISLVKEGKLSAEDAADSINVPVEDFQTLLKE